MILYFDIDGRRYRIDADAPHDIAIPLDFEGEQPSAFHLPRAVAHYVDAGGFVGDTRRGGSCNCETVTFNPHGNGTHTESVGHISNQRVGVGTLPPSSFVPAALVSIAPEHAPDESLDPADPVISRSALESAVASLGDVPRGFFTGLVIRTLPNVPGKRSAAYSGANPPYISHSAMRFIRERGVEHLLVDLPSVDREDDAGALGGHRIFWGIEPGVRDIPRPYPTRTITEMIFVDDAIADGLYVLDLQIPAFMLDAAPSRPVLFQVFES